MALTTTLAELADAIQRTADVKKFTDRHPLTQIYELANRGLGALDRAMRIVAPDRRPLSSTTIPTDGIETSYELPANCRTVIAVEYTGESRKTWLLPFEMHERAMLTEADAVSAQASPRARAYRIFPGDGAQTIELLPRPPAGHSAFVWYATNAKQFVLTGGPDTAQAVDIYDRLDDYVIWWAARELAKDRKEWELHDRLGNDLRDLRSDIEVLARLNDISGPARPVDRCLADRYGRRR